MSDAASREEMQMLRRAVEKMRDELFHSRSEAQRSIDQLTCLISLVRKAWGGDQSAANHVAKIVGFSAPDYIEQYMKNENQSVCVIQPKSQAVNNWALLSIGLLNREYRIMERHAEQKQRVHLQQRAAYLDEQLSLQLNIQKPERGRSADKKRSIRHLYRPAAKQTARTVDDFYKMSAAQMFIGPAPAMPTDQLQTNAHIYDQMTPYSSLFSKTSGPQPALSSHMDHTTTGTQEDSQRYLKAGIYNADTTLYANHKSLTRRPMNGTQQRYSDTMRARPKSAVSVLTRGDRPMKYETTRPIIRPSSHKPRAASYKAGDWLITRPDSGKSSSVKDKENAKPCKPVVRFAEDLCQADDMQENFEASTIALQKKLGVDANGFV